MIEQGLLQHIQHWLLALGLVFARMIAIFSIVPFLSSILKGQIRNGVIVSLCLIMLPAILPTVPTSIESLQTLMSIIGKEVLIGFLLGFVISIPFWAIEGIGFIIDNQRGASMASIMNPMSGEQTSLYGSLLLQLAAIIFFTSGGFQAFLSVIFESYRIWPIQSFFPKPDEAFALFFLEQMDYLMELIILYAAPIVIAVFIAEFGLGLVNRFAQQLNVFSLSMPIKSGIACFLMILYIGILAMAFKPKLIDVQQTIKMLAGILE
jgi:type III secretion protein T